MSQNPNWNLFLEELASQLGLRVSQIELIDFYVLSLSRLNISMDITPHTGISFSASDAAAINSTLATHKVHFDSSLVSDYKLLNLTWYEPPAPSEGKIFLWSFMFSMLYFSQLHFAFAVERILNKYRFCLVVSLFGVLYHFWNVIILSIMQCSTKCSYHVQ